MDVGLRPLFHPEVCDLFANTVLEPRPLLLQQSTFPVPKAENKITNISYFYSYNCTL